MIQCLTITYIKTSNCCLTTLVEILSYLVYKCHQGASHYLLSTHCPHNLTFRTALVNKL